MFTPCAREEKPSASSRQSRGRLSRAFTPASRLHRGSRALKPIHRTHSFSRTPRIRSHASPLAPLSRRRPANPHPRVFPHDVRADPPLASRAPSLASIHPRAREITKSHARPRTCATSPSTALKFPALVAATYRAVAYRPLVPYCCKGACIHTHDTFRSPVSPPTRHRSKPRLRRPESPSRARRAVTASSLAIIARKTLRTFTSAVAAAPLAVAYVLCVVVPSSVARLAIVSRGVASPFTPSSTRRRRPSRAHESLAGGRLFSRTSSVARALATRANRRSIVVAL